VHACLKNRVSRSLKPLLILWSTTQGVADRGYSCYTNSDRLEFWSYITYSNVPVKCWTLETVYIVVEFVFILLNLRNMVIYLMFVISYVNTYFPLI